MFEGPPREENPVDPMSPADVPERKAFNINTGKLEPIVNSPQKEEQSFSAQDTISETSQPENPSSLPEEESGLPEAEDSEQQEQTITASQAAFLAQTPIHELPEEDLPEEDLPEENLPEIGEGDASPYENTAETAAEHDNAGETSPDGENKKAEKTEQEKKREEDIKKAEEQFKKATENLNNITKEIRERSESPDAHTLESDIEFKDKQKKALIENKIAIQQSDTAIDAHHSPLFHASRAEKQYTPWFEGKNWKQSQNAYQQAWEDLRNWAKEQDGEGQHEETMLWNKEDEAEFKQEIESIKKERTETWKTGSGFIALCLMGGALGIIKLEKKLLEFGLEQAALISKDFDLFTDYKKNQKMLEKMFTRKSGKRAFDIHALKGGKTWPPGEEKQDAIKTERKNMEIQLLKDSKYKVETEKEKADYKKLWRKLRIYWIPQDTWTQDDENEFSKEMGYPVIQERIDAEKAGQSHQFSELSKDIGWIKDFLTQGERAELRTLEKRARDRKNEKKKIKTDKEEVEIKQEIAELDDDIAEIQNKVMERWVRGMLPPYTQNEDKEKKGKGATNRTNRRQEVREPQEHTGDNKKDE